MKKKLEEEVIQRFPYRCPYCDQPISYNQLDLKKGENKIECPSCKKDLHQGGGRFPHALSPS